MMQGTPERRPKVILKENFVVEENIDSIRWPQECSVCGGAVEQTDDIKLKKKFKNFGEINVDVLGIPYCKACFAKSRRTKFLDNVTLVISLILGIPLSILAIVASMATPGTQFVWFGLIFVLVIGICYGVVWLVVKFPIRALFKGHFVDLVNAWLIEEKKSDGREGVSVVIEIPNKVYANKFAQLNEVVPQPPK